MNDNDHDRHDDQPESSSPDPDSEALLGPVDDPEGGLKNPQPRRLPPGKTSVSHVLNVPALGPDPSQTAKMREALFSPALHRAINQARTLFEFPGFRPLQIPALKAAADASTLLRAFSPVTGQLAAIEAAARIGELVKQPAWMSVLEKSHLMGSHLAEIASMADVIATAAASLPTVRLPDGVPAALAASTRGLDLAARLAPERPDQRDVLRLDAAVHTTHGTVRAVTLLRLDEPEDNAQLPADGRQLHATLDSVQISVPRQLRAVLADLHERLPARLEGAVDRLRRPGPDAASQAAHSLQECLDWALRLAAPDDEVLEWHRRQSRPGGELSEGRPTRGARIWYLTGGRPDEDVVKLYVKSVNELIRVLQGFKHGVDAPSRTPEAVAAMVPTIQAYLSFLLVGRRVGPNT